MSIVDLLKYLIEITAQVIAAASSSQQHNVMSSRRRHSGLNYSPQAAAHA